MSGGRLLFLVNIFVLTHGMQKSYTLYFRNNKLQKNPKQTKNIEKQKQGQPTKAKLNQEAIYKAKQKPSILQSQSSSSQSNALLCSVGDGGQQQ